MFSLQEINFFIIALVSADAGALLILTDLLIYFDSAATPASEDP